MAIMCAYDPPTVVKQKADTPFTVLGWLLSLFVLPPHKVLRSDGTYAGPPSAEVEVKGDATRISPVASLKREASNLVTSLSNWRIILLIPMFFCANFFYSYQQNSVNGDTFTLRTRSLNGAMYWIAQMLPHVHFHLTRRIRARVGWTFVFVMGMAIWGGGLAFQRWKDRDGRRQWLDFEEVGVYVGPFWLYFFYGAFDAFWQSFCYWMMASLARSPQEAAKFVGLYKTFQATGGAVSWRINALHYSAMTQFVINWSLVGASMVVALPSVLSVSPHPLEERVKEDHGER
ncbi:hypothetical protein AAF712_002810 [Marasmius tenuissimus]|uniref:UNC93-like protein n=1 Tax=Marasmius tenuissimus TaxID=585030 RepID=A0ABR3A7E9_9AGAR